MRREHFSIKVSEVISVIVIAVMLLMIAVPVLFNEITGAKGIPSSMKATNLALALFNYNTDNGFYPSGKSSTQAFKKLFPDYLQDPVILFLTKAGAHEQYTGATINSLTNANVCWTLTMNNEAGLKGDDPTDLPLLLSDLGGDYPKFPAGGTKTTLTNDNIWGLDGVTIARMDQSTAFLRPNAGQVTLTNSKFQPTPGADYTSVAP